MNEILYTTALNEENKLVKAADAKKSSVFCCPFCKGELILRKSQNSGKYSKRPHFAHKNLMPSCSEETLLHYSFKILLFEYISEKIKSNEEIIMNWKCKYCNNNHNGNLIKKVTDIKLEHNLSICQPDIALFVNNIVFAVIEVVVTHKPEFKTQQFYKDNNIILIQINLNSDTDIDNLKNKIENPDIVDFCMQPKCKKCENIMITKELITYKNICSCGTENLITYIQKSSDDWYYGIWDFSKKEIEIAKEKGVNIKWQKSKNEKFYMANICKNCGKILKEQSNTPIGVTPFPKIPEEIFHAGEDESYKYIEKCDTQYYRLGYFCDECDRKK